MTNTKHTTWLAEAAEAYLASLHGNMKYAHRKSSRRDFIAGHDAALRSPVVRAMAEALETYIAWASGEGTLDSERAEAARKTLEDYATMGGPV